MTRTKALLTASLLLATLQGVGQSYQYPSRDNSQYRDNRDNRDNRDDRDDRTVSQYGDNRDNRQSGQYGDNRDNRNYQNGRRYSNFNNGLRQGGRGGDYYDSRHANDGYDERYQQRYVQDDRYYRQRQGGIGPGKGALIGGAGGAVLGTLFGGGLKGTLIGGAAGAGIGAVVGEAHQNNERRENDNYYPR